MVNPLHFIRFPARQTFHILSGRHSEYVFELFTEMAGIKTADLLSDLGQVGRSAVYQNDGILHLQGGDDLQKGFSGRFTNVSA